jgi:hypothetical protein
LEAAPSIEDTREVFSSAAMRIVLCVRSVQSYFSAVPAGLWLYGSIGPKNDKEENS